MREENVEEEEAIITKTNDMKYTSYKNTIYKIDYCFYLNFSFSGFIHL